MNEKIVSINKTTTEHSRNIKFLRDPPEIFYCGYKYDMNTTESIITYNSLFYSRTNQETGGLDLSSGLFTAGYPGTYTVTWSLWSSNDFGDDKMVIYLYKNGKNLGDPSKQSSWYNGPSGYVRDFGGRSLIVHLDLGETLNLYCKDCSSDVYHTTLCIALAQFDQMEP